MGLSLQPPTAGSAAVSRSMSRNGRHGTRPEMDLRRALFRRGLRFRVDTRPVVGLNRRADVVLPGDRVAIYMHGCFWHGCVLHYRRPRSHSHYWATRLEEARARDMDTERTLREKGWVVVTVWEHEDISEAADRIVATVRALRCASVRKQASRRLRERRIATEAIMMRAFETFVVKGSPVGAACDG